MPDPGGSTWRLRIDNNVTLKIDLVNYKLEVQPGGGVLVRALGSIRLPRARRHPRRASAALIAASVVADVDDGAIADAGAARITVRGTARQVLAFFAALGDDRYPFVADGLRLYPVAGSADVLQADLVVTSPVLPENPSAL